MIDFQNTSFLKLKPSDIAEAVEEVGPLLMDGEVIRMSFRGMRDSAIFTDKRLITVNVPGMTGKKRDDTSLPDNKIQAWSVETAGRFDLDAELELWFSGLGKVHLDFKDQVDIRAIGRLIGEYVL